MNEVIELFLEDNRKKSPKKTTHNLTFVPFSQKIIFLIVLVCWNSRTDWQQDTMDDAHCKTVEEVLNYFNADPERGLTLDQVKRNQEKYGPNGKLNAPFCTSIMFQLSHFRCLFVINWSCFKNLSFHWKKNADQ